MATQEIKDNVNIGDIFVASWGYDQTNIDFYQVISRTAKMVTVRAIKATSKPAGYAMASIVMPLKDQFLDSDYLYDQVYGKPFKRRLLKFRDNVDYFRVKSYAIARKWDGKSRTETYTG